MLATPRWLLVMPHGVKPAVSERLAVETTTRWDMTLLVIFQQMRVKSCVLSSTADRSGAMFAFT